MFDNPEVLSCKGYLKTGCAKDTLSFSGWGGEGRGERGVQAAKGPKGKNAASDQGLPSLLRIQQFYIYSVEERE